MIIYIKDGETVIETDTLEESLILKGLVREGVKVSCTEDDVKKHKIGFSTSTKEN